jgi:hypothetical protein
MREQERDARRALAMNVDPVLLEVNNSASPRRR